MNSQDRCGPWRDRRLNFFRVKSVILGFDIHEDGPDLVPEQCMRRRHKRERSGDNLSGKLQALQADLKRQGAIVEQAEIVRVEEVAQLSRGSF